jgi:hypothetical protein
MANTVSRVWSATLAPAADDEPGWELALRRAGVVAVLAGVAGGIWGFVRGLGYLPTLAFAVAEGAAIFAVPGLLLGAVVGLVSALRLRRARRR